MGPAPEIQPQVDQPGRPEACGFQAVALHSIGAIPLHRRIEQERAQDDQRGHAYPLEL